MPFLQIDEHITINYEKIYLSTLIHLHTKLIGFELKSPQKIISSILGF